MARVILAFGLLGGFLLLGGASASAATPTPDIVLSVGDDWFCNSSFQGGVCKTLVSPGTTVQWDFSSAGMFTAHTTTECGSDCDNPTGTPLWDSGVQTQGDTFKRTFNDTGQFLYFCTQHPDTMRGIINVGGVGGVAEVADPAGPSFAEAAKSSGPDYDLIGAAAATALVTMLGASVAAWRFMRRRS